jgi:hypothetical protein
VARLQKEVALLHEFNATLQEENARLMAANTQVGAFL